MLLICIGMVREFYACGTQGADRGSSGYSLFGHLVNFPDTGELSHADHVGIRPFARGIEVQSFLIITVGQELNSRHPIFLAPGKYLFEERGADAFSPEAIPHHDIFDESDRTALRGRY